MLVLQVFLWYFIVFLCLFSLRLWCFCLFAYRVVPRISKLLLATRRIPLLASHNSTRAASAWVRVVISSASEGPSCYTYNELRILIMPPMTQILYSTPLIWNYCYRLCLIYARLLWNWGQTCQWHEWYQIRHQAGVLWVIHKIHLPMFGIFSLSKTSYLHLRSKTAGPCESVICTFYEFLGEALSVDVRDK